MLARTHAILTTEIKPKLGYVLTAISTNILLVCSRTHYLRVIGTRKPQDLQYQVEFLQKSTPKTTRIRKEEQEIG
jgi:hypothetical protein